MQTTPPDDTPLYSIGTAARMLGISVHTLRMYDREHCAAPRGHSQPCWTYSHRKNICAKLDCRICAVYKISSDCSKVKDAIAGIRT